MKEEKVREFSAWVNDEWIRRYARKVEVVIKIHDEKI